MSLKESIGADENALETVAGVTGIGWTTSLLGYLVTVAGYSAVPSVGPRPLLYLGGFLLVTTLGLDRLKDELSNGGE